MEIELLPTVSPAPETNSLLIAPVEMLAGALNSHLESTSAEEPDHATLETFTSNGPCAIGRRSGTSIERNHPEPIRK
jgi:hypothetical protein